MIWHSTRCISNTKKEIFDEMNESCFFHQIRVSPKSIKAITAFRTRDGHCEFNVMHAFRLDERHISDNHELLLQDIYLRKFVLIFFNDILIYSPDWTTHLQHRTNYSLKNQNVKLLQKHLARAHNFR